MPQRYFCAVPLPPQVLPSLHALSTAITGTQSTVRFPHITIIPPFFLREHMNEQQMAAICKNLQFEPFGAHLSTVDTFTQHDRVLLVAHVEPKELFAHLNQQLAALTEPFLQYDSAPYTNRKLPAYAAHTTISYNAKLLIQPDKFPYPDAAASWTVTKVGLYKEMGPGMWEEVLI